MCTSFKLLSTRTLYGEAHTTYQPDSSLPLRKRANSSEVFTNTVGASRVNIWVENGLFYGAASERFTHIHYANTFLRSTQPIPALEFIWALMPKERVQVFTADNVLYR
jgi:hypothetical protein